MLEVNDFLLKILFYLDNKDISQIYALSKRTRDIINYNRWTLIKNILGHKYKIYFH